MDRRLEVERKLATRNATEPVVSAKSNKRIKLFNAKNTNEFTSQTVALNVQEFLYDEYQIALQVDQIHLSGGLLGPYFMALPTESADILLGHGEIEIMNIDNEDEVVTFKIESIADSEAKVVRTEVERSFYTSIFLPSSLAGIFRKQRESNPQIKHAISLMEWAITTEFGPPSSFLRFEIFQPRSDLGNPRNTVAVAIKYNTAAEKSIKLQDVSRLSLLKYLSLGLGKQPIMCTIDQKSRQRLAFPPAASAQHVRLKQQSNAITMVRSTELSVFDSPLPIHNCQLLMKIQLQLGHRSASMVP